MKAVIVIDIPDDYYNDPNLTDWAVDYDLRYVNIEDSVNESLRYMEDVPLRTLPQPLDLAKYPDGSITKDIAEGYNMCLKEITGETE